MSNKKDQGFRILKGNIPIRYGHLLLKLWKVCCWLTAFLPPLINGEEEHEEYNMFHMHEVPTVHSIFCS